MKELTIEEIIEKYRDIEDKIPSVWPDYPTAGQELARDIAIHWDISEGELIRVISLMEIRVPEFHQNQHINSMFAFAGLYPERMRTFNIQPDSNGQIQSIVSEWSDVQKSLFETLLKKRIDYKNKMKENDKELEKLQEELNKLKENSGL
jgi:hypothetical protein